MNLNILKRKALSYKKPVTSILIMMVVLTLIAKSCSPISNADKIKHIAEQIKIEKQNNIDLAWDKVVKYMKEEIELRTQLDVVVQSTILYSKCITANEENALPTDCSAIVLTAKESLDWKYNSEGRSQSYVALWAQGLKDRTIELLASHPVAKDTYPIWEKYSVQYWIDISLAIAIAKADSSLGNSLKTTNNIGNVGNNDRGDTQSYSSIDEWIEAIFRVLNNQYLWNIYTVWYLSQWWRTNINALWCSVSWEYCYATSKENWNINVINTLRNLHNDSSIGESYNFRLWN